jgi:hypothetical protein
LYASAKTNFAEIFYPENMDFLENDCLLFRQSMPTIVLVRRNKSHLTHGRGFTALSQARNKRFAQIP